MRDAEKDLKLCEQATPGPWSIRTIATKDVIKAYAGDNAFCIGSVTGDAVVALTDDLDLCLKPEIPNDTKFIAESREALPYWIREFENQKTQLKIAKLYLKHALLIIEAEEIGRTPNWEFWSREVEDFLGGIANE